MMKVKKINTEPVTGKMDSFFGDRSIVMPTKILNKIKSNPLTKALYITDIGFYPYALHHYRTRKSGIHENILIYCISGSGTIQVHGQSYLIKPNSYFVIPAHRSHSYWAFENDPWSIYWIHFGGAKSHRFEKFFGVPMMLKTVTTSRVDDRINLFNEILTSLELGFSQENIEFANLSLSCLLASFFYVETYRASKGYHSKNPVEQAIFFMQENLNKCIKIQDIANKVQLSESHLSKIFRNRTGSSPFDYFINLKMQEAIRLLTNKSMRIKEVAFALGYEDPFYFSRLFKKHIGKSPGAFVKTTKK
ncbi:transcriptional regulator, AraC family [Tangfeifania diversioriginum]|uniref:Transcriptional regulator, AraC family n=1 Tax=Tangfeifania diversioriginum TaxID=1168035 RepID=A0A1M6H2K1_9BACT|nr:AraC family transcriptional regulator [Tangfeifania diversioriginum]SHJ16395.1 transcriptional regulator, AraC family [Tangfeifania diversioriginum]